MRADRLISILLLLQTRGRMTAHDLAAQLEVSERTIYRDLEALGIAGIPVYTERGPGGGCSLIDGYQTRLTGLTEAEVRALFLFNMAAPLTPLADLGLDQALDDALLKLQATLPAQARESSEQVRQRIHLDTSLQPYGPTVPTCLQTLQQAVLQTRQLCIVYPEHDGTWRELQVEPYGLVTRAHAWYLVGLCHGEYDVFHVALIHSAEISAGTFVRSDTFDLIAYWADYCANWVQAEKACPPYLTPLHNIPEQKTVIANHKVLPFRSGKQKKGISRQRGQEKKPYKKNSLPRMLKKRRPTGSKKNAFPLLTARSTRHIKKTSISSAIKKTRHLANKKKPLISWLRILPGSIKKTAFSRLQKKCIMENKKNKFCFRSPWPAKEKRYISSAF